MSGWLQPTFVCRWLLDVLQKPDQSIVLAPPQLKLYQMRHTSEINAAALASRLVHCHRKQEDRTP